MRLISPAKTLNVIAASVAVIALIAVATTVHGYLRDQAAVKKWADGIRKSGDRIREIAAGMRVGDSYAATMKSLEGTKYEQQGDEISVRAPRSADDHDSYVSISGDSFGFVMSNGVIMKISKSLYPSACRSGGE